MNDYVSIIRKDPAMENIISFAGSSTTANNAGTHVHDPEAAEQARCEQ